VVAYLSSNWVYEVYVEDVNSSKYICFKNQKPVHIKERLTDCTRLFGEVPYERVLDYVDLERAVNTRSIIVLREDPSLRELNGFIVEKGTLLCLQEVTGKFIYFLVGEGTKISSGDIIAYHVTGKFEVRSIKSKCEGQVALIVDMPWEVPRRAVVVVVPFECRRITIEKSA